MLFPEHLFLSSKFLCRLATFEILQLVEALHSINFILDSPRFGRPPAIRLGDKCRLEIALLHFFLNLLVLVFECISFFIRCWRSSHVAIILINFGLEGVFSQLILQILDLGLFQLLLILLSQLEL